MKNALIGAKEYLMALDLMEKIWSNYMRENSVMSTEVFKWLPRFLLRRKVAIKKISAVANGKETGNMSIPQTRECVCV